MDRQLRPNSSVKNTQFDNDSNKQNQSTNTNSQKRITSERTLATALGWFSVGLGLAQLIAPRRVANLIGVSDDGTNLAFMAMVGLRELTGGIGLLSRPRPVGWVQARIAGDIMDMALLGTALVSDEVEHRNRLTVTTAAVVGISVIDLLSNELLSRLPEPITSHTGSGGNLYVRESITVNRPIAEVYAFWHDFENLPRFMSHLEAVKVTGPRRSHWVAKAPAGRKVEWDAEMITDVPNEQIIWRSLEGADIDNSGSVMFRPAPGNRGTEIRVELRYKIPAGRVGAMIAKMFGEEPELQIADDLRAFKQFLETGQIVRSEGTEPGKRLVHRPAQPQHNTEQLASKRDSISQLSMSREGGK